MFPARRIPFATCWWWPTGTFHNYTFIYSIGITREINRLYQYMHKMADMVRPKICWLVSHLQPSICVYLLITSPPTTAPPPLNLRPFNPLILIHSRLRLRDLHAKVTKKLIQPNLALPALITPPSRLVTMTTICRRLDIALRRRTSRAKADSMLLHPGGFTWLIPTGRVWKPTRILAPSCSRWDFNWNYVLSWSRNTGTTFVSRWRCGRRMCRRTWSQASTEFFCTRVTTAT